MAGKRYESKHSAEAFKNADPRTKERYSGKLLEGMKESDAYGRGMTWDDVDALLQQALPKVKKKKGGQV